MIVIKPFEEFHHNNFPKTGCQFQFDLEYLISEFDAFHCPILSLCQWLQAYSMPAEILDLATDWLIDVDRVPDHSRPRVVGTGDRAGNRQSVCNSGDTF